MRFERTVHPPTPPPAPETEKGRERGVERALQIHSGETCLLGTEGVPCPSTEGGRR